MVLLIRGSIYNSSCVRFIPTVKTQCHFQFDSFSQQRKMEVDEGKERAYGWKKHTKINV